MIRRPPRSTHCISSAASDVYKRQVSTQSTWEKVKYLERKLYEKSEQVQSQGKDIQKLRDTIKVLNGQLGQLQSEKYNYLRQFNQKALELSQCEKKLSQEKDLRVQKQDSLHEKEQKKLLNLRDQQVKIRNLQINIISLLPTQRLKAY
eukprot:TRINITY_DN9542_c0_g1_i1.p2 TRINITY_DN9542_c0_g1~~TRINITY_DN9542_c0_g1_i1.p2  ORF type:complete len:148 (-),score=46.60 TRINITY_DN9542_c0_g1_i1:642-1085(-)